MNAGIYRYVKAPTPKLMLKLSGLKRGALKLGRRLTAAGVMTPSRLAGSKIKLKVQKKGARWVTAKTLTRTLGAGGVYSWSYKPAKRGAYRLQVTIAKAATHSAAKTTWRCFKVK